MEPLRLEITNFMPYRNRTVLDFESLDTIFCLSGENGAGKSSILEAITFALFGSTRLGDNIAELLHGNEEEMDVSFEFALEDDRYRVIRRYKRAPTPKQASAHSVVFQVWDGSDWMTLSPGSVRETDAMIRSCVRMDHRVFLNSSYLAQGRSAEFTQSGPTERKAVLGRILGLDLYDRISEKAKEDARDAELKARGWRGKAEHITETMCDVSALNAQLKNAQTNLKAIQKMVKTAEQEHAKATTLCMDAERAAAAFEHHEAALARLEQEIRDTELRRDNCRISRDEQDILARKQEIEDAMAELASLDARNQEMNELLTRYNAAKERLHEAQTAVAAMQAAKNEEQRSLASRQRELASLVSSIPSLENQVAELRTAVDQQRIYEDELNNCRAELGRVQEKQKQLAKDQERLERDGKLLKVDLERMETDQHCPVCGSDIDQNRHDELLRTMRSRLEAGRSEWQQLKREMTTLQERETILKKNITGLESKVSAGKSLVTSLAGAESNLEKAKQAKSELEEVSARLAAIATVDPASPLGEALNRLAQMEKDLAAIGYVEKDHRRLLARQAELGPYKLLSQKLYAAAAALTAQESRKAELVNELAAKEKEREQLLKLMAGRDEAVQALKEAKALSAQRESELSKLRDQEMEAAGQVEALRTQLADAVKLSELLDEAVRKSHEAESEASILGELAQCFGRKGVQALIIESALPELEATANHLLDRLSDGRQQVSFQTQKATKSGKIVETLELEIRDEYGKRSYEGLSGGEAFRVDVAIRIALAQLLARRAGAKLQLLVVDEGFGSQDSSNLQRLVEALHAVKDIFRKIIVVSHITEVKELFPSRVEVLKGEEGSKLRVISIA